MGRSEKYRRFAQECVEMARTVSSPQTQAAVSQPTRTALLQSDPRRGAVKYGAEILLGDCEAIG
jgi:hypothetical protein